MLDPAYGAARAALINPAAASADCIKVSAGSNAFSIKEESYSTFRLTILHSGKCTFLFDQRGKLLHLSSNYPPRWGHNSPAAAAALSRPSSADCTKGSPAVGSDTVSFQTVDGEGNAVSMVNSNYLGFGSGLVPEGCGFALQNRGANFSLEPGHPNELVGGKRCATRDSKSAHRLSQDLGVVC